MKEYERKWLEDLDRLKKNGQINNYKNLTWLAQYLWSWETGEGDQKKSTNWEEKIIKTVKGKSLGVVGTQTCSLKCI